MSRWFLPLLIALAVIKAAHADPGANCVAEANGAFAEIRGLQQAADFAAGKAEFSDYLAEKKRDISDPIHLPYLLDHGGKTRYAVVLVHGLYESPYYLKSVANALYEKGFNVVTVLLPGHWTNPPEKMDRVSSKDWQAEVARGIGMAKKLGDHVLMAGYSVGGLLAIDAALASPGEVKGVFAWAPAMGMSGMSNFGSVIGSVLSVTGNRMFGIPADGSHVPYLSPHAGLEVSRLEDRIVQRYGDPALSSTHRREREEIYRKLHVPLFMVNSDQDEVIDPEENLRVFDAARGPKTLIRYGKEDRVSHNAISKDSQDADFLAPGDYNYGFSSMANQLDHFIDQNFPDAEK